MVPMSEGLRKLRMIPMRPSAGAPPSGTARTIPSGSALTQAAHAGSRRLL